MNELWIRFLKTGSITDYLKYKKAENSKKKDFYDYNNKGNYS